MPDIKYAQTEAVDKGSLKVEVLTNRTRRPIEGARITISYSGDPDSTVEEVRADDSGMSEKLTLDAPPLEYSMEPSENQPFAQYTVKVTAPGYRPVSISGVQVFSEQLALQQVRMAEEKEEENLNLAAMEKRMIEKAIARYGKGTADKKKVAEVLGIGVATLYRKKKKYGSEE